MSSASIDALSTDVKWRVQKYRSHFGDARISIVEPGSLLETLSENGLTIDLPFSRISRVKAATQSLSTRKSGDYKWFGDFEDGHVILNQEGERVSGEIRSGRDVVSIHAVAKGVSVMIHHDTNEVWKSGTCGTQDQTVSIEKPKTKRLTSSDLITKPVPTYETSYPNVRVLVLYTTAALNTGLDINSVVSLAFSQYSSARNYSTITTTLEHVGTLHLNNLTETSSGSTPATATATALRDNTTAQSLRNAYEADIVICLTDGNYSDGARGSVITPTVSEPNAYGVVEIDQATSDYTFIHEIAHLFGCRHEYYVDNGGVARAHAWDWQTGFIFVQKYASIMRVTMQGNMFRTLHYSNPNVTNHDKPTGNVDQAFNAAEISLQGATVMNHRYTYVPPAPMNVSVSGPDYAGSGESLYFYTTFNNEGVEPYSYNWYTTTGASSTSPWLSTSMPYGESMNVYLTVTDATSQSAYAYKTVTNNGLSYLKAADIPESNTAPDIYPNPATNHVNFTWQNHTLPYSIALKNNWGQTVSIHNVTLPASGDDKGFIDIENLPAGVYYIIFNSDKGEFIQRIIKK
jgi:hypothetical protein